MSYNFRLYSFVNFYLSSIQQGVQTQHVASELYNEYAFGASGQAYPEKLMTLETWSRYHKTTIILNGGNNESLQEILRLVKGISLEYERPGLPWANFYEDEQSLGKIMTSVGIVLPQEIYDAKTYFQMSKADPEFAKTYQWSDYANDWFFYDEHAQMMLVHKAESVTVDFLNVMKTCQLAR